jgi:hypothetical protein
MTGIDILIEDIRGVFQNQLFTANETQYFGKVYSNVKTLDTGEQQTIAEIFDEVTQDYREVQFNDALHASCFFVAGQNIEGLGLDNQLTRDLSIVFIVNLDALFNDSKRDVERVYSTVLNLLKDEFSIDYELESLVSGVEAYGGFDVERLKHTDIHPYHVFRVNGIAKIFYNNC